MVELFISQRGTKSWYLDHQRHRANGPAIQFTDGVLHWFWYGHPHRENGPAVVWADGAVRWHWHGRVVTEYEHMILAGQEITND